MKANPLIMATLGLSTSLGLAFEVPHGVHEIAELDKARAKAADRPELVSFLISKVSLNET